MRTLPGSWDPGPARVEPADRRVHVWRVPLDVAPAHRAQLSTSLSREEEERARHCRMPVNRDRSVVAWAAVRDVLSRYTGTHPGSLCFVRGPRGRPRLTGPHGARLDFNLSHSRAVALIAVARGGRVGVDVETIDPSLDHRAMARRFLGPDAAVIRELPDAAGRLEFFTRWTWREAYAKAVDCPIPRTLDVPAPWRLWNLAVGPGVRAALAAHAPTGPPCCWQWEAPTERFRQEEESEEHNGHA
ncbi:4'-phosphopantetheinyl transferase family protein [Streptomyces fragilis]|uniref:4'-phosphopantetheinyl transferase superfamily protein n=1 Tax=Streptomyces fragilis TaxID=67301 RepID=A0ABV2YQT1_9ACTN|nr:4'-phosphopantetheinyl transferase superfamily protein [Streptomyces fragilis]